jgi:hypothetical protein
MKIAEKRDYIHSSLHQLDERTIDELFDYVRKHVVLTEKLSARANKSEEDIRKGKTMTKSEIQTKLNHSD